MESLLPMFPPVFCYELDWYMIDGDRVVRSPPRRVP